jgi:hypothetical protein
MSAASIPVEVLCLLSDMKCPLSLLSFGRSPRSQLDQFST